MADLMTLGGDRLYRFGVPCGGVAGDEEGAANRAIAEHPEQSRHSHLWPVRLMTHRAHPVGQVGTLGQKGRLSIYIESERGSAISRARPDGFAAESTGGCGPGPAGDG